MKQLGCLNVEKLKKQLSKPLKTSASVINWWYRYSKIGEMREQHTDRTGGRSFYPVAYIKNYTLTAIQLANESQGTHVLVSDQFVRNRLHK